jgi:RimK family alpha-L-glutamate ligase
MKMAIIYGEASTTHQLMIERAEELFDTVLAAPADGIKFIHGEDGTQVMYKGTDITEFDVVYTRNADEEVLFTEHLAEVLNDAGVVTQVGNDTYPYMTNKFYTTKILAENGIDVPDSVYILSPDTAVRAAKKLDYPIIMKTVAGGGGEGVMRATSEGELKPVMDTMKSFDEEMCLQEYMEHNGTDNRVIVIGDHVVGYQRSSSDSEEWRSNISGGGERVKADISEEMEELAIRATRSIGAHICGCDIIETENGMRVLEMNAGAFAINEQINETVGEDVIFNIVDFLHQKALQKEE